MLLGTLGRYLAIRFVLATLATFAVCATLIVMIDLVELLRLSGRAGNVPSLSIAWIALLRMASHVEILLPFCVMVGSGVTLIMLNRRSELAVMRAAGISAWQFLSPGLVVAAVLGILSTAVFNPVASQTRAEADRLFADLYGREATNLGGGAAGAWLRQEGADGSSVVNASAASRDGRTLYNLTLIQFDALGRFVERVEARKGTLQDGYWQLDEVLVARASRQPERFATYTVSTYLTADRTVDQLGASPIQSVWELPALIRVTERAGLSAAGLRVQFDMLLSRPVLLVAMVLLAGSVSLRSFRSGRLQTMVAAGAIGGLGFLLFSEVARQIGTAGLAPSGLAVWVPVIVALCGSLTVLLHQEDG